MLGAASRAVRGARSWAERSGDPPRFEDCRGLDHSCRRLLDHHRSNSKLCGGMPTITRSTFQAAPLPGITAAGRTLPRLTAFLQWVGGGQREESVIFWGVFSSVADSGIPRIGTG